MTRLLVGLSLGLGAGLSPGPLQAMVVTATLQRGLAAGIQVAVAPLLTDVLIVGLAVASLRSISPDTVAALGQVGGLLVVGFGLWELWRTRGGIEERPAEGRGGDLLRGALVNLGSPHPWVFWIAVGGPLLVEAWSDSQVDAIGFLAGFYATLVGSKVGLAIAVAKIRHRLDPRRRLGAARIGAALLVAGGVLLLVG